jgi:uncharacterized cupin superfamily protein
MTKRHPQCVNLADLEPRIQNTGKFQAQMKQLGVPAGAKALGRTWVEVPPGKTAFPRHFHCVNEEALFVLSGTGTVRIGAESFSVGPGDWVSFLTGPDHPHQIIAGEGEPLRYLGLSTKIPGDVVGYPDSKKIGAMAMGPDSKPVLRMLFEESSQVDYWKGEV